MAITVRDVTKRFGDFTALENVSIAIANGGLTVLLGPSGSGKSTLLRVIAGLERPDSGQVVMGERDVTNLPPQQRDVGFVFQHYAAFKHMTVWENVAFGLRIRRKRTAEVRKRVGELLALVQLSPFADRYPHQLSGGQRQRMALARALAIEPGVLLLDEPFGALDKTVRTELRTWLRRLHDEVHVTTVLVTHDQEEAMDVADEIVMMNHGRVEQVGEPSALYEHPANLFVMTFLGQTNRIDDLYVRPHDVTIHRIPNSTTIKAVVTRVVYLGFEVRVELALVRGGSFAVQLTRAQAQELGLERAQVVHLQLEKQQSFDPRQRPVLHVAAIAPDGVVAVR